jgi:hypothetical protein
MDASTAVRFHFGEMVLSVPWRAAQVAAIGASPLALSVWQTATLVEVLFHHSNVELPVALERWLCRLIVTPRMHGIHHSTVPEETASNWSSGLTAWDWLHGTLRLNVPSEDIVVGVPAYREAREVTLPNVLAMPFEQQRDSWRVPGDGAPRRPPLPGPPTRLLGWKAGAGAPVRVQECASMRPYHANGKVPPAERPFRVLLVSGSDRRQYNCPGVDSKSRALMLCMAGRLPQEWEIDMEDLGNVYGRPCIQGCNAWVSTSMALCVWPCNCYEPDDKDEPDLMWDLDLYARLDLADAWAVIGPVNWYGPTSNLNLMFDRLVCMNGGNPREDLIDHMDPERAMKLEHSPDWEELSQNHLEGRTAAFFCYGDGGGDESDATRRPKMLRHKEYFDPAEEPFENDRGAYAPLVWQCRYSGIEVPEALWRYVEFGRG